MVFHRRTIVEDHELDKIRLFLFQTGDCMFMYKVKDSAILPLVLYIHTYL